MKNFSRIYRAILSRPRLLDDSEAAHSRSNEPEKSLLENLRKKSRREERIKKENRSTRARSFCVQCIAAALTVHHSTDAFAASFPPPFPTPDRRPATQGPLVKAGIWIAGEGRVVALRRSRKKKFFFCIRTASRLCGRSDFAATLLLS
jgi:hypothetical protein